MTTTTDTAYLRLHSERPELFRNPPGAPIVLTGGASGTTAPSAMRSACTCGTPAAPSADGVVYRDRYLTVLRDPVRFPDGTPGTYLRVLSAPATTGVAVLPVLPDGRIALLDHFRHATRRWHLEIPRGGGEDGEDAESTARREVHEELGTPMGELFRLGDLYADTGILAHRTVLFLGRLTDNELPAGPSRGARREGITGIRAVTPAQLAVMMRGGRITDSFTLAALAQATVRGLLPLLPGPPGGSP